MVRSTCCSFENLGLVTPYPRLAAVFYENRNIPIIWSKQLLFILCFCIISDFTFSEWLLGSKILIFPTAFHIVPQKFIKDYQQHPQLPNLKEQPLCSSLCSAESAAGIYSQGVPMLPAWSWSGPPTAPPSRWSPEDSLIQQQTQYLRSGLSST